MVKGNQRQNSDQSVSSKYVGLTKVEVKAVNPTIAQRNKLFGKEDSDKDQEIDYLGEDKDGNRRVKLAFYLYDAKLDKYFVHSINLLDKVRLNLNGDKMQFVNQTCNTGWAPLTPEGEGDESLLVDFFTNFQDKEKQSLGPKAVRPALVGEEELATFLRAWLGRLNWNNPEAEVLVDTEALFNGDFSELQNLIDGDLDAPFVVLLGVETDADDTEKQYQKVWPKGFLPGSFMKDIDKGFKFNDYAQKAFKRFEDDVLGEYGFKVYFELEAIKEYDRSKDTYASPKAKADVTSTNPKF